jgi:hypothetical protein
LAQKAVGGVGNSELLARAFTARGHGAYSHLVKGATEATTTTDWGDALSPLRSAFVASVDRQSLIGPLLDAGALSAPLNTPTRVLISAVTPADEVAEAQAKPTASLLFELANTPPHKVVRQLVFSSEVALSLDPQMQALVRASLVSACAAGVDALLVNAWTTTSGTEVAGNGATAATIGSLLANLFLLRTRQSTSSLRCLP